MNTEPEKPVVDDSAFEDAAAIGAAADVDDVSDHNPATSKTGEPDLVQQLQEKLAESEKQYLIAKADLENYRKRAARDAQDRIRYASLGLMTDLLGVSDNLDRAIASAENESDASGLLAGVKMVAEQIQQVLESHGCQKIEAVGSEFDPNFHEALQMQPSDEFDANTVIMEVRPGFRLHDRVVRPTQVFVSTGPATDS